MDQLLTNNSFLRLQQQVRIIIVLFIVGLVLSGITAFPIQYQLTKAHEWINSWGWNNTLSAWLGYVYKGVNETYDKYPFIAYGTDWLAFAHVMLAVLFIGPLRDPIKNIWVIEFGMIACAAIIPLAFIMGPIRHIPFFWTLVDWSFGIFGIIPLYISYISIKKLERFNQRGL